jgi:hypothetical protein
MIRLLLLVTVFLPLAASQPGPQVTPYKGVGVLLMGALPCADPAAVRAAWWHNWTPNPDLCPASPGFVPTIWGPADLDRPALPATGPLFAYNEPDIESQANVDPEAAALATAAILDLYPEHLVIGATISHLGQHTYYPAYLAELDRLGAGSRLHGLSLNCYDSPAACKAYVSQVRAWADERAIPTVWLKEFRYDDLAEAQDLITWMDAHGIYYAWFMARLPAGWRPAGLWSAPLIDDAGGLTPAGRLYRGLP